MKKRLLLGTFLGLATPISTVIACATGTNLSEEDQKAIAEVKTPEFKKALENMWINKVINDNYDEATLQGEREKIAEFILFINLQKDNSYLSNLATSLRQSANNGAEENEIAENVEAFNFNDIYFSKAWDKTKQHNGKTAIQWLLSEENRKRIDLHDQVQKILVVSKYLSLEKNEWEKVFEEEEGTLSSLEKALVDSNFPFLKEAVNKNYFLKWNTTLEEKDSLGIRLYDKDITQTYTDNLVNPSVTGTIESFVLDHRNKDINKNQQIKNFTNYYGIKSNFFGNGWSLESFKERPGFQGFEEMSFGRGKLDFSLVGWEEHRKTKDFVSGYLQDNELVSATEYKIEGTSFDLTKVVGLLPYYDESTKKIQFDEDKFNLNDLKILFAINNEGLFDQAVKYYTTKEDPIVIDLGSEFLNEILDEEGNPYIIETQKRKEKEEAEKEAKENGEEDSSEDSE